MRQPSIEVAQYWAKTGTDILFTENSPFNETVDKDKLEENLYNQILKNLVDHNTSDISEEQLQNCINNSKID